MAEKLAKLAKERLIKVANRGTSSGARPLPADSTVLQPGAFMYVFGSAGARQTDEANPKAFDKWAIILRMMRDSIARILEVLAISLPSYDLSDEIWSPDNSLRSQAQVPDTLGPDLGARYPPSRG